MHAGFFCVTATTEGSCVEGVWHERRRHAFSPEARFFTRCREDQTVNLTLKAAAFILAALIPIPSIAQSTFDRVNSPLQAAISQASPEPSPKTSEGITPAAPEASPSTTGIDTSNLTPQQQAALQQAIVKISQNPVGNIAIIPFQNNFNYGVGPYTRFQYNLNIQPVVPFMLSKNMNLVARTIIPIISQPTFAPPPACAGSGCSPTFGLGDIQEQLFFAPKTKPGELIWGAGPIFQSPSASPSTLGAGKWAAGPALVGLITPGHIVTGVLVTQLWSFAGQVGRPNISAALFQPFFNYNLKDGWAISTAPILTANWNATQNKWAIPLGGGIAKTFKAGDQIMQLSAQYYTYIARPLTNPQTNLKISWSLLYPIKRGIDIQELLKENQ
jgi:hypothetical protein